MVSEIGLHFYFITHIKDNKMSKHKKKSNKVVKDMKECFRAFDLPIYEGIGEKPAHLALVSQICNDRVCASVIVTYYRPAAYATIYISFQIKVSPDKLAEVWQLLNLLNGMMPLYQYAFSTCCNSLSLKADLLLPDKCLPVNKFKRLLHDLLEDSYLCVPLIESVIAGGDSEKLYKQFMDDHRDLTKKERSISKETERTILNEMETVLGWCTCVMDENRRDDGFTMRFHAPKGTNYFLILNVKLCSENDMVTLHLASSLAVPDEKLSQLTELAGRINALSKFPHLHIDRERNRVSLYAGIMIDNGVLDQKEFDFAVRMIMTSAEQYFPLIEEQLSTNETPDALVNKTCEAMQCLRNK